MSLDNAWLLVCLAHPAMVDNTASVEAFDKQMAVNARSVMLCYKHAAKQMVAQGRGGRIIGTSTRETYARVWSFNDGPHRRIFHGRQAR